MANLKEKILTASGEIQPDIIFTNAGIVNVFTGELEIGDIAIKGDTIVGIGKYGDGKKTGRNTESLYENTEAKDKFAASCPEMINCQGKFICPGLLMVIYT